MLVLAVLMAATPASATKRLALVIGNDVYAELPQLRKAVNDASAMRDALAGLGYEVVSATDATRKDMTQSLARLESRIEPGDEVFFFYAGHGVAIGSENYLIPTDMSVPAQGEESLVEDEAVSVDKVIRRLQSRGAAVAMIVLDACRDNPFSAAARGTRSIGASRGLTRIEAPSGVFVLFSAGLGQTALDALSGDDTDPNSVFTRSLLPLLRKPGLSHVGLAKRVQAEVIKVASSIGHRQEPAYYDQINGEIVLVPKEGPVDTPPDVDPGPSGGGATGDASAAARDWRAIADETEPEVYEAFLARHTDPIYVALAKARLKRLQSDQKVAGVVEPSTPAGGPTLWMHNGSTMRLEANGVRRRFLYDRPRKALEARGVVPGTLLFDGEKRGDWYVGTAYVFSESCGPLAYQVEGPVAADLTTVTMTGQAPKVDGSCTVVDYKVDELVFTYAGKN
ncbi:MAG: caspase family protein [Hyphomicrobiaceae bacterium]